MFGNNCRSIELKENPITKRWLSYKIDITCRLLGASEIRDSDSNKSISVITNNLGFEWEGPVVVGRSNNVTTDGHGEPREADIDLVDFRHVVDTFMNWKSEATVDHRFKGSKVKAVKINCVGDQNVFKAPVFEAVEISVMHPIFSAHDRSAICDRIGVPVLVRRIPPHPLWKNESKEYRERYGGGIPYNNTTLPPLLTGIDPSVTDGFKDTSIAPWGWAPIDWWNSVGSVLVVREDKKPLAPLHVEGLCRYCSQELHPYFQHAAGEFEPKEEGMSKDQVLAMISRPSFVIYWSRLQGLFDGVRSEEKWEKARCP